MPADTVGSRRTPTRTMSGATSLSSSSHFAAMLYSKRAKPVESRADRVSDASEHDGHAAAHMLQRRHAEAGRGENDVRLNSYQFRCILAKKGRIVSSPANVDPCCAAISPSQGLQFLEK